MSSSEYQYAHRGKNKGEEGAPPEGDWLDSICDQATTGLCPVPGSLTAEELAASGQYEPDILDHIFEGQQDEEPVKSPSSTPIVAGLTQGSRKAVVSTESTGPVDTDNKDTLDQVFEAIEDATCGKDEEEEPPIVTVESGTSEMTPEEMEEGQKERKVPMDRFQTEGAVVVHSTDTVLKEESNLQMLAVAAWSVMLIVVIILIVKLTK
eukprot:Nitzschia sp. Nitz4//scaffold63_size106090//67659//68282//NITZ4_004399-RA/size106090-processed-gene-0.147-mRNA-1//-1//CDS//3329556002//188//frame0